MKKLSTDSGFTLLEVLIAMVLSTVILGLAVSSFFTMQSSATSIDQRSNLAVNARNSMYLIEDNIRLMGYNPEGDMSRTEVMNTTDGCSALGGFLRFNRNDLNDPTNNAEDESIGIGLLAEDDDSGGSRDGFADNGATSLVIDGGNAADDIAVLRFAYAFDDDGDGNVDLSANDNIRWAIDTDNDGFLDTEMDTDDNGIINGNDTIGGTGMTTNVDISTIKAVKVWIVIRSQNPVKSNNAPQTFVVGDQRFTPNNNFAHTLFTTTIRCRNMT